MTADPLEGVPATNWRRIALVVIAGICAALHVGKVPPALPALQTDLNLSLLTAGWVLSLTALIGAIAGVMMGVLADSVGHRRAILGGLGLLSLGSLLGAAAGVPSVLLGARAVESCGLILVVVAAPGLILSAARPNDQRMAFALWGTWLPLGVGSMMLASPLLLNDLGWRASWIAAAAATLLLGVLLAADLRDMPRTAARAVRGNAWGKLQLTVSRPGPWLLGLSFCFYSMSFLSVFGFLPTFLVEGQGVPAAPALALTAVAVYSNAVGNITGGMLAQRGWRRWQLIAIACATMGLASFGIFSDAVPGWLRYALCVLFAGFGGLLPATVLASAPAFAPRRDLIGTVNGMIVQGINVGQLVGPPILAAIVGAAGSWSAAPVFLASAAGAGLLVAFGIRKVEIAGQN